VFLFFDDFVYSGDVNGRFRRDVNKVRACDAGACNDARNYSHASRGGGRMRVSGRPRQHYFVSPRVSNPPHCCSNVRIFSSMYAQ
jgi:hypothetical protein